MALFFSLILMIIGFACLAWGANILIANATKLALRFDISPMVIGLTIISFGTTLPEMVVSILAAVDNNAKLAVGNAVGSNIANIGLVLGLTACFFPVYIKSEIVRRQIPILFFSMLLLGFLFMDGKLGRVDGCILIVTLVIFILTLLWKQRKIKNEPLKTEYKEEIALLAKTTKDGRLSELLKIVIGLAALLFGAEIIVRGASNTAAFFGVNQLFIGLTIVAIGTSLPELATAIAGARRKQYDMVIGNVIGANIFNLLGLLPITAVISPFSIEQGELIRDFSTMVFLTILLYFFSFMNIKKGVDKIARKEGVLLLLTYIAYITILVIDYF